MDPTERLEMDIGYTINGTPYHDILKHICLPRDGLKVLEPGCGSGKFGAHYALHGCDVTLLDIDPKALDYAAEVYFAATDRAVSKGSVVLMQGSVHRLPFPDSSFDFVFNEGVANHFGYNPHDWRRQRCLNEMVRVTKPGGHACAMVDNAHCEYVMERARNTQHDYKGMPPRQKPFTADELVLRLLKAGLCDIGIFPASVEGLADCRVLSGWGVKT